jgi:hypothetical protein
VYLACRQIEVEPFQDLAAIDIDVQIIDFEHYDISLNPWH